MRKDIKQRLEKALITLQEPGGSTIRSILKVINKDSPVLSLRKVLEALQEGINEGFLCMYNGRFKLKQQTCSARLYRDQDILERDEGSEEERDNDDIPRTSDSDMLDDESDLDSEGENVRVCDLKKSSILKQKGHRRPEKPRTRRESQVRSYRKQSVPAKGKRNRCFSKCRKNKSKCRTRSQLRKSHKWSKDPHGTGCDSLLEITPGFSKKETTVKQITEKPDVKKQRGPRCTSMKKDVRMPSKVHIPFLPPTAPQRSNFNDLLRRSPEPVNGPLFDCNKDLSLMPENLGFFGTYC